MNKNRNVFIELLRFLFSVAVIVAHFRSRYPENIISGNWNGHIAVEFFFIVSGFFMAAHCERTAQKCPPPADKALWRFVKRKISGMAPVYYLVLSFFAIRYFMEMQFSGIDLYTNLTRLLPSILFLSSMGLQECVSIPFSWYIGAMMLSTVILFPLIYLWQKKFTRIAAPLIVFFFCAWAIQTKGKLFMLQEEWLGICYPNLIRAIGDTCAGIVSYEICEQVKKGGSRLRPLGKVILTAVNLCCFGLPFYWIINGLRGTSHPCVLLMFMIGVAITVSGYDYTMLLGSGILLPGLFRFLGKISLPLYLSQGIIFLYFNPEYAMQRYGIYLFVALCICTAVVLVFGAKGITILLSAGKKYIVPLLIDPKLDS